jgi:hypothetical protein
MRITKQVTVDTEVEIDLDSSDVLEILVGIDETYLLSALSTIAVFLKSVQPEKIKSLSDSHRSLIRSFLLTQAERF